HLPIWVAPIYGGQPISRQIGALRRGVHVIVATPGRMLDHLNRGTANLGKVRLLVLDEADQMLEMGFLEDVEAIMNAIPAERQTALFSATIPNPILDLARKYMKNQEIIRLTRPRELTVPRIEQEFVILPYPRKVEGLVRILDHEAPERALAFCSTKRMVDTVVEDLRGRGFRAAGLHGDMSQAVREATLNDFRRGHIETLIATDVAARGLDIPDVALVVNFDIPFDAEAYTHRIGRTARYGKEGRAVTFVNPREMRELKVIERITGARIRKIQLPTPAEVAEKEQAVLAQRVEKAIQEGRWAQYMEMAEDLANEYDPMQIAAAAISLFAQHGRRKTATPSEPAPVRQFRAGVAERAAG
ncbi:MAG TPA: DEAD/DEAH box helicase, partial [Chloroflexota bacterium]|nr:DEAD/DEAH box helicase [Chloroflexota bacterium]